MKFYKLSEVGMKEESPLRFISILLSVVILMSALTFTILHFANLAVLAGVLVAGAAIRLIYALFTGK
jgi:polyferredoxin